MKISVILGSPRKKDSFRITQMFEKMLGEEVIINYIQLSKVDIRSCLGCDQCFQVSEKNCPHTDSVQSIVNSIEDSDGIVIASPVYAYQVPGQFKTFIDRTSYLFHRPTFMSKPAVIITTTDGGGGKAVYDYLKMTLTGWGVKCVGGINIISTRYFHEREQFDIKYHDKKTKQLSELSQIFLKQLKNSDKMPSYYDLFMFNCLRSKTYTSEVDKKYWVDRGWMNKLYFKDIKLPLFKRIFAQAVKHMIHQLGKKYS